MLYDEIFNERNLSMLSSEKKKLLALFLCRTCKFLMKVKQRTTVLVANVSYGRVSVSI